MIGKRIHQPILALLVLAACGCGKRDRAQDAQPTVRRKPASFHPTSLQHAQRFTISYHGTYKVIEVINPWRNADRTFRYVLYARGSKPPELEAITATVPIPVETVVITSTTFAPYLARLNLIDKVGGMTNPELVNTPEVVAALKRGDITNVGGTAGLAHDLDIEKILVMKPDVVLTHASGTSTNDVYPELKKVGIKTVLNGSYMESTPLGRTEWIKFVAAFFNKEQEAEALFDAIAAEYESLARKARNVKQRPTVLCNVAYNGTWYLPGGNSYMAKYLNDAGADYPWANANDSSGGVPTSLEEIISKALDADYWLNPGSCRSIAQILAIDSRYKQFQPLQKGEVYNHTLRINENGGQDYWESGAANPHLVLADLLKIFHPELVPGHETVWYEKLPAKLDQ